MLPPDAGGWGEKVGCRGWVGSRDPLLGLVLWFHTLLPKDSI